MNVDWTYAIQTWGCKVNTYDSGLLEERMQRAGFQKTEEGSPGPRVHLLNTCAVTAEATKESLRHIRRLKAKDPFCTVVVTGCGAQVDTEKFENYPGADLVIANSHKGLLEDLLKKHFRGELKERVFKSNIFRKEDLEAGGGVESGHTRSFLKVQDGCNSFCTYCVIPFARGKSRSIPIADLLRRINELYSQGIREVVVTGIHIGDYEDQGRGLEDLVEVMLATTEIPRFRISSLEPIEVTDRLLKSYENPRMCPHFHMSIQSANTKVLHDMKRKYTALDVEESLKKIARLLPEVYVGMDVIAGFPGETEDEFEDTFQRLSSLPWTRLHVFPYSERPGTKAAQRDDAVPQEVIRARAKRLRDLSDLRQADALTGQIGKIKHVMYLKNGETLARDYWTVRLDGENGMAAVPGSEILARVTGVENGRLVGSVACL